MQPLGTNDAILFLSLVYSCVDLSMDWDQFSTCSKPIHQWLVGSYACVVALRVMHLLGMRSKAKEQPLPGAPPSATTSMAADFLLDMRSSGWVCKTLLIIVWFVLLPAFIVSTLTGTSWLYKVVTETPECVPSSTHLWFAGFWLVMSYCWMIVHLAIGVVAFMLERRVRKAEADLASVAADGDAAARWGNVSQLSGYQALNTNEGGLTPTEIRELPGVTVCGPEDADEPGVVKAGGECAICIMCFDEGDQLRTLSTCGHSFHKGCIDLWLLRRADCPLCKQNVKEGASCCQP